jgi:hypothetical protein
VGRKETEVRSQKVIGKSSEPVRGKKRGTVLVPT